jgi:hypothetical protein
LGVQQTMNNYNEWLYFLKNFSTFQIWNFTNVLQSTTKYNFEKIE